MKPTVGRGLLAAALLAIALLGAEVADAARMPKPRITWSAGSSRNFQMYPGTVQSETITFVSDRDIADASVAIFPGHATVLGIRADPADEFSRDVSIGEVVAGQPYEIELRSEIPITTTRRSWLATVRVRDGRLALNQPMRVVHRLNYTSWRRLFPVQRPTSTPRAGQTGE